MEVCVLIILLGEGGGWYGALNRASPEQRRGGGSSTVLRVEIEVEIEGLGRLSGELKRYLAPMTFDELVKRMPLSGAASLRGNAVYMQTEVRRGAEKPTRLAKPGDILYWPPSAAILLVFAEGPAPPQAVKIGNLTSDPSILSSTGPGARIVIRRRAAPSS